MVAVSSEVVVRAYDLGGFGDIAGAMRVASHMSKVGLETKISAKGKSAFNKLLILRPDVAHSLKNGSSEDEAIQVDIAGHYKDERNAPSNDVPHVYTEDMDNFQDRRRSVPVYLKSGLASRPLDVPVSIGVAGMAAPMFYRPFREWELPKPEQRDSRRQMLEAINATASSGLLTKSFNLFKKRNLLTLAKLIEGHNRIGFAHLSPQIQSYPPEFILEHPYFASIHRAHLNNQELRFAVGLFLDKEREFHLANAAMERYWNVVRSDGDILSRNKDLPTLVFLGPQPQTRVTGLFLSSDIPNLVTGDLSLSDALYGLIAMNGPGFFYECPDWKIPTHVSLMNMISRRFDQQGPGKHILAQYFFGSNHFNTKAFQLSYSKEDLESVAVGYGKCVDQNSKIFWDRRAMNRYTEGLREAIRAEIRRRFGATTVVSAEGEGDFYIPPGAPYLLQDATTNVVERLREDPESLGETERARDLLKSGAKVVVNVNTGVLEPQPYKTYNTSNILDWGYNFVFKHTSKDQYKKSILSGIWGYENYLMKINEDCLKKDYADILSVCKKKNSEFYY